MNANDLSKTAENATQEHPLSLQKKCRLFAFDLITGLRLTRGAAANLINVNGKGA
jgi:hypothetical protein